MDEIRDASKTAQKQKTVGRAEETVWFEKTFSTFIFNYKNATMFSVYVMFIKVYTRNSEDNFLLFSVSIISYAKLKPNGLKNSI